MLSGLKLLLVDDDRLLHDSLSILLGIYNSLTVAPTIQKARELLEGSHFDLILLDKNLPDGSGVEFLPSIREKYPDVAIIIITGDSEMNTVVQSLKAGADDYLIKGSCFAQDLMTRIPVVLKSVSGRKAQKELKKFPSCKLPDSVKEVSKSHYDQFHLLAEREYLLRALDLCEWDTGMTSRRLGIGRSTLFKKMGELNIRRTEART